MSTFKSLGMVALAVILLSLSANTAPPPASAAQNLEIHLTVKNESTTCAWLTIYAGKTYTPWMKQYWGWIHPRSTNTYVVNVIQIEPIKYPSELKVRAEFKKNADCTGGTVADYHVQRKDIYGTQNAGWRTYVQNYLTGPPWSVKDIVVIR